MGMIYRQKGSRFFWIKYYRNGRPVRESAGTEKETEAKNKLKEKEGDIVAGRPVIPHADRVRFEELAEDLKNDYRINAKRSQEQVERCIGHLKTYFAGWRAIHISTASVRAYIAKRQDEQAANANINRDLAALKRMFSLAMQAEKLLRRPYIPHLAEDNVRRLLR